MPINFYSRIALTGGGAGALDEIDGAVLADGDIALVGNLTSSYLYCLDDDSGAAESSPAIIQPDANAGTKRWILLSQRAATFISGDSTYGDGSITDAGAFDLDLGGILTIGSPAVQLDGTAGADSLIDMSVGSETNLGRIILYGARGAPDALSAFGGIIDLYTGDDHDGSIAYYRICPISDDLYIGPDTNPDALIYDGALSQWKFDSQIGFTSGVIMRLETNTTGFYIAPEPDTDHTFNGTFTYKTVDTNAYGAMGLVYLNTDGNFDTADKDTAAAGKNLLGLAGSTTGNQYVLLQGVARDDTWNWSIGEPVFMGDSGALTNAAGVAAFGSSDYVRCVGKAISDDAIWFSPSNDWILTA